MGAAAADVVIGTGPVSSPTAAAVETISPDVGAVYRELRPTQIQPNPQQPAYGLRRGGAERARPLIREFGLMQPIVVRRLPEPQGRDRVPTRHG